MKIAIAGAGLTGAYAYNVLRREGFRPDLFERGRPGACGIAPCAWGTSRDFVGLLREVGLTAEKYILTELDHVWMDDVRIRADLMTFDKPALIRDLTEGAEIKRQQIPMEAYDRVIDASGISRAYLPGIQWDMLLPCIQYRVVTEEPLENRIRLGGIGYTWCFPLAGHGYHIGCGSLALDPEEVLRGVGWLEKGAYAPRKILCSCSGKVRLTGPHAARPFFSKEARTPVWGVGESIGCVAPLAGDGVVPGMKTVRLLMEHWNDPTKYTHSILEEFEWMAKERHVIDRLRAGDELNVKEAWVLKDNSGRMGMHVGLMDAVRLLKSLRP